MPRTARTAKGGLCYHVLNRGNERRTIFHNDNEYASFVQLLEHARAKASMRVLAYCLMPNHFHLCLWPVSDGDLSRFMQWLMTKHVHQFRKSYPGAGHVWQGRFKAFIAQDDAHLLTVIRYIERNPVRAGLVANASEWSWSSASLKSGYAGQHEAVMLHSWPIPKPVDWDQRLGVPEEAAELEAVRKSASKGVPFGEPDWVRQMQT